MIQKRTTTRNKSTLFDVDKNLTTLFAMTKNPLTPEQQQFFKIFLNSKALLRWMTHPTDQYIVYSIRDFEKSCSDRRINLFFLSLALIHQDRDEEFLNSFGKFLCDFEKIRILVKSKPIKVVDEFSFVFFKEYENFDYFELFVRFNYKFLNLWADICDLEF